jgi:hypothetical protein
MFGISARAAYDAETSVSRIAIENHAPDARSLHVRCVSNQRGSCEEDLVDVQHWHPGWDDIDLGHDGLLVLQPGETVEVKLTRFAPQVGRPCSKMAMSVVLEIDDHLACAQAGTFATMRALK